MTEMAPQNSSVISARSRHQRRARVLRPRADLSRRNPAAMDHEPDERQQKELQSFMEMENQKAVIQAAISKLTETCFDKCVSKPGNKLDSSEANCIANCAGRYLDNSVFVVNRMMAKKAQVEIMTANAPVSTVVVANHSMPAAKPAGKTFEGGSSASHVVQLLRDEANVL